VARVGSRLISTSDPAAIAGSPVVCSFQMLRLRFPHDL
jgi:hypothetical protein